MVVVVVVVVVVVIVVVLGFVWTIVKLIRKGRTRNGHLLLISCSGSSVKVNARVSPLLWVTFLFGSGYAKHCSKHESSEVKTTGRWDMWLVGQDGLDVVTNKKQKNGRCASHMNLGCSERSTLNDVLTKLNREDKNV